MHSDDFWLRQSIDKPLFEDILWARPENKRSGGKLLIAGGNAHGFAVTGEAYQAADKAGAGVLRVLLPDALKKTVGVLGPYEFAASTPSSGSFGRGALIEFMTQASWSDGVLLAGDLGRNSETAILLESFVKKYGEQLTLTKDAVDYFHNQPGLIAERPQTMIVLSMGQLQKLARALKFETPFLLSMGLVLLVKALHEFSLRYPAIIVTKELNHIVVARNGKVSSTKLEVDKDVWRAEAASKAAVLWMQNKNRPFEAITSSIIV